jgi:tRNA (guanine37-N1)-methyltransferase
MHINVLTIFPGYFDNALDTSIAGRAAASDLVEYRVVDLRDYTHDRHRTVDDEPYGGGAGMVMKPEPFFEAIDDLDPDGPVVLLSPRGARFDHATAVRYSLEQELTLLCGHYKGVDERVAERLATEMVSIGDYVLSGGEPAALVVIDAVVRLLPGALGDHLSASTDSFYEGMIGPPVYTRPSEYRGMKVPEVLRSGDHAAVERWRAQEAKKATKSRDA